jgi:hypothetical protein
MRLRVECYSGRKPDERPIQFWIDGTHYRVEAVLDQWYDPESLFYKVRADDGQSLHPSTMDIDTRGRVGVGLLSPGRIASLAKLAAPADPHPTSIHRKVENADEHACNRKSARGDIGIDHLVQVMEQESALIRLHARLGFEPVLKHS